MKPDVCLQGSAEVNGEAVDVHELCQHQPSCSEFDPPKCPACGEDVYCPAFEEDPPGSGIHDGEHIGYVCMECDTICDLEGVEV